MEITVVRHAETDYNCEGKLQGVINIPLNDKGRRNAKSIKSIIRENEYDICFTSPLIRTVETAMILVGDIVEIRRDDRLIERSLGNFEGKEKELYDGKKYWDYNLNSDDEEVEKVQDIFKRCNDFIDYLKENYSDKSILIVSHGAVIRCIHHILLNTNLNSNLIDFDIYNCYIENFKI